MRRTLFILLFLSAQMATAKLVRVPFEGVRPTGMGNAFLAIADDANALWYNPAGLAQVRGFHFNLFDFILGVDNSNTLSRLNNALFDGKYKGLLRQDTQFIRLSTLPTLITPYFGLGFFDNLQMFTDIGNLQRLEIDAYGFNDLGVIAGFGFPVGDLFRFGFSTRLIQRSGVDATLTIQDLLAQVGVGSTDFLGAVYDNLRKLAGTGWGVGLTVGSLLRVPLATKSPHLQFAATVEDFGYTSFRKLGSGGTPPRIEPSYNFGVGLNYTLTKVSDFNVAMDARHVFSSVPVHQMFHFGLEYRHRFFALRTGAYQGYPTLGVSFEALPHTRIHFSSYSVELGQKLWERQHRWYLLQVIIGFSPI